MEFRVGGKFCRRNGENVQMRVESLSVVVVTALVGSEE